MSVLIGIAVYLLLLVIVVALVGGNRSDDEMHERVVRRIRSGLPDIRDSQGRAADPPSLGSSATPPVETAARSSLGS